MKVGEIWEYVGKHINTDTEDKYYDEDDLYYDEDDLKVKIIGIYKEDDVIFDNPDGEFDDIDISGMEDLIEFEHLGNGAVGILDRTEFVKIYRKVYA